MGLAVFAGMLVATAIGVLLVPALFVLVEGFGGRRAAPPPAPAAGAGHG
jgi:HAE1 family hydrophobic/amphiphilic exporter-1